MGQLQHGETRPSRLIAVKGALAEHFPSIVSNDIDPLHTEVKGASIGTGDANEEDAPSLGRPCAECSGK